MDQLVQVGNYPFPYGVHHHVHLLVPPFCWGHCFLLGLPSSICPPLVGDYHSARRHLTRCVGLSDVARSFGLAIALTPSCIGSVALLLQLEFVPTSLRR